MQGALLIALHRPDVVRPDDLALRHAVQAIAALGSDSSMKVSQGSQRRPARLQLPLGLPEQWPLGQRFAGLVEQDTFSFVIHGLG